MPRAEVTEDDVEFGFVSSILDLSDLRLKSKEDLLLRKFWGAVEVEGGCAAMGLGRAESIRPASMAALSIGVPHISSSSTSSREFPGRKEGGERKQGVRGRVGDEKNLGSVRLARLYPILTSHEG